MQGSAEISVENSREKKRVVFLYSLLLALLWGFLVYWEARAYRQILLNNRQSVEQSAASLANQTNRMLKCLEAGLVASASWISAHPDRIPWQDREFVHLVSELRRISSDRVDIRLVSRQGRLYRSPPGGEHDVMDVSDRDYFRIHQSGANPGVYIAAPVLSRLTGKWSIPLSLAITEMRSPVAEVHGVVELDDFMALSEPFRPKPGGMLGLVRDDGVILAHWPVLPDIKGTCMAMTRENAHFKNANRGSFLVQNGVCGPGTWFVGFSRLADYPVVVFLSSPVSTALAPWRVEVSFFVLLSFAVSIITMGVVCRMCRMMDDNLAVQRELSVLATFDGLTGLYNRQAFLGLANREAALAKRGMRAFSVALLDVDGFKKINDTHGHAAGDEVLRRLGVLLRQACREADMAGRVGGEEFAVLLSGAGLENAVTMAERLRQQCQDLDLRFPSGQAKVTVSAGVVEYDPNEGLVDHALQRADAYLYAAKRNGRNRVESPLSAPSTGA